LNGRIAAPVALVQQTVSHAWDSQCKLVEEVVETINASSELVEAKLDGHIFIAIYIGE